MAEIELADVLVGLRKELQKAQAQAAKESLRFRVDAIDVEVKLGVTKKKGGKAGVKFWVLDIGGDVGAEQQAMQTVRLKLTPDGADGGETFVSDQDEK
jgi:hypothetical protein